jgi:prepilin-type N-terminal cleavage/methylation domain-containing protein
MDTSCKGRKAFTLIELLIVMAILGVLIALLLPSLSRARDRARLVSCIGNLRQIVAASILYASEHGGYVVSPNWGGYTEGVYSEQKGWLYTGSQMADLEDLEEGLLWPYLGSYDVYRCPMDIQPRPYDLAWWPYDARMVTSYMMNGSPCNYSNVAYDPETKVIETYLLGEFQGSDILFWEQRYDPLSDIRGDWWDGSNTPDQGFTDRHHGKGVVGYADGRAGALETSVFMAMAGERFASASTRVPPGKNALWNIPHHPVGGGSY